MRASIRKRKWNYRGKKTRAWTVDWSEGTRRRRKQFKTRQEAKDFLTARLKRRRSERYGVVQDIAFKAFVAIFEQAKTWRSARYRENTILILQKNFRRFDDVNLAELTAEMVEGFKRERMVTVSASTVRNDLAALSGMCRWAVRLGYLAENPVRDIERPPLPVKQDNPADYMPPGDFAKLLNAAGRDTPLYEFATYTGLRLEELVQLEWPDVRDGFVTVRQGKGRKQRLVPLLPEALEALKTVPRHPGMPRIFWWAKHRVTVNRRFKKAAKRAKLAAGYHFHVLRHTFASWALMAGVPIEVVAKAMGHSSIAVTRRYGHLAPDYQRLELRKMSRFAGPKQGTRQ
jgi:integrase